MRNALWRQDPVKAVHPLTHHEILRLIEPLTRRGRQVDLAATNRLERSIVFKPKLIAAEAGIGAYEILRLENPRADNFRLIRTLTLPGAAEARLSSEGSHPGELLARIEAIAPQRQFQLVAGCLIARNYRLEPGRDGRAMLLVLNSAEARLEGVLRRRGAGWTGSLRLPRSEPARSRRIERELERAVAHLAQTLAEPPRRFHERLVGARWGVVFRRTIPVLSCLGLIAATAALTLVDIPQDSMLLMMIFNFPPLLMLMLFGMRELPRFEIPPLPRPSTAASWLPSTVAGAAATPDPQPS
ncbi:hypothetical protein [Bradyrhizobium sp.]|uniref:hypothetical protein n=1 Tax=Bradyrhizobium sp. TaxID=376 RepID=UPI003C1BD6B7